MTDRSVAREKSLADLRAGRPLVLDGGFATQLESLGMDISGELWSAQAVISEPDLVGRAHRDFLDAGADIITSATYQATIEGFVRAGDQHEQSVRWLRSGVSLALQERDRWWTNWCRDGRSSDRLFPLVAASVGPYGAFLADGSEYTGRYQITDRELDRFHRRRWAILADSGADLLACETIPCLAEVMVLLELLRSTSDPPPTWFALTCRDGRHLRDGGLFRQAVLALAEEPAVTAIGVNCVSPEHVLELVREVVDCSDKPVVVYPNSGEIWNADSRSWSGSKDHVSMGLVDQWLEAGASIVGGCCRVSPRMISRIRDRVLEWRLSHQEGPHFD